MDNPQDPRESRLPRWAQEELKRLRAKLRIADEHIGALEGTLPDSDTYVLLHGAPHSRDMPLPDGAAVVYRIGETDLMGDKVHVRVRKSPSARRYLEIQGEQSIAVEPRAANVVWVRQA